ncbi:MAG: 2-oxoacid:ferredoxin oxidoreductase subunit beta [Bryobacteraceae bacterium]|nr:2-oxoacid:ferredoxin oxidoreductase subunit beta [Bryobacteraceae bacterium]
MSTTVDFPIHNPVEDILRMDRIPTIWCPGCGIGTSVNSFAYALLSTGIELKKVAIVSGIGCSGRVSGYTKMDSFHVTHGRAIPFATGLKLANPELTVVVYSGDGDLTSIGGNHLIHAARRNMDLLVVCVNNMIYAMTGGQAAATTPGAAISTTTPYGSFEPELNIAHLVDAAGASFVARWTVFHVKMLEKTMKEALSKKGFRFIEVLSPCPTLYGRRNNLADGLAAMKDYKERSKIRNGAPTHETALVQGGEIVVGKFVDRERPDYLTLMRQQLGANYHPLPPQPDENPEAGVAKEDCCSC